MSRHKVELYKSIARKISATRFPPLRRHRSAPESIYNSRMTLHIPDVTYRRYRETITHSSRVLYFFLSLSFSLNRAKWNAIAAFHRNSYTWNRIPDAFENSIFLKRYKTRPVNRSILTLETRTLVNQD